MSSRTYTRHVQILGDKMKDNKIVGKSNTWTELKCF
jgi:hypothetical protein